MAKRACGCSHEQFFPRGTLAECRTLVERASANSGTILSVRGEKTFHHPNVDCDATTWLVISTDTLRRHLPQGDQGPFQEWVTETLPPGALGGVVVAGSTVPEGSGIGWSASVQVRAGRAPLATWTAFTDTGALFQARTRDAAVGMLERLDAPLRLHGQGLLDLVGPQMSTVTTATQLLELVDASADALS